MKKILQVVSSLNINAGMMSVVMNYYRYIDRSKIQFDFLYFFEMDKTYEEEIKALGGKTYFIGKPSFGYSFQKKLDLFLKSHAGEYTAMHCHPIFAPEIFSHMAKKNGIKHIIAHSHSTQFSENKISAIRNRILNMFVGFCATSYIACSPEAAYLYGKKRVERGDVMILRNSIECEKFRYSESKRYEVRKELCITQDAFVVGHVGRCNPQKNHRMIIDVFCEYHKLNQNSILLLVGDGETRKECEEYASQMVNDNSILFVGKRLDIPDVLSAFDVFLMPSLFEGAPVSAIEAQASGLPCFLSDTITKSIDVTDCKYISIQDDPKIWANVISKETMINERSNAYLKMIESGFDIKTSANELENYYRGLL